MSRKLEVDDEPRSTTIPGVARPSVTDVVVLVHGIRDRGQWHQTVHEVLQSDTLRVTGPKYGYFNLFRFLSPWDFSKQPRGRVLRAIRDAKTAYPHARISVIAHSFGTHLVTQLLVENPDIELFRIIFCGSVVRQDFHWSKIRAQTGEASEREKSRYIVNDCGNSDIWPAIGTAAGWRYGNAGTDGFGDVMVTDRYHPGDHGLFFDRDFIEEYWKPFIYEGAIVRGKARQGEGVSSMVRLIAAIPLNWLILVLVGLCVLGIVVSLGKMAASRLLASPRETVTFTIQDKTTENRIMRPFTLTYVTDGETNSVDGVGQCAIEKRVGATISIQDVQCSGGGYTYAREDQTGLAEGLIILRRLRLAMGEDVSPAETFAESIKPAVHPMDDDTLEKLFARENLPTGNVHPLQPIKITVENRMERPVDLVLVRSDSPLDTAFVIENCGRGTSGPYTIFDTKPGAFYFICVSMFGQRATCVHQDVLHGQFDVVLIVRPENDGKGSPSVFVGKPPRQRTGEG